MLLYGYPTTNGWSRVIVAMIGPKDSKQKRPATPQLGPVLNFLIDATQSLPVLVHALNRNAILDGDSYFLHAAVSNREWRWGILGWVWCWPGGLRDWFEERVWSGWSNWVCYVQTIILVLRFLSTTYIDRVYEQNVACSGAFWSWVDVGGY